MITVITMQILQAEVLCDIEVVLKTNVKTIRQVTGKVERRVEDRLSFVHSDIAERILDRY